MGVLVGARNVLWVAVGHSNSPYQFDRRPYKQSVDIFAIARIAEYGLLEKCGSWATAAAAAAAVTITAHQRVEEVPQSAHPFFTTVPNLIFFTTRKGERSDRLSTGA